MVVSHSESSAQVKGQGSSFEDKDPIHRLAVRRSGSTCEPEMVGENCSCEWLNEKLVSRDDGLLLLDCRSADEYHASHVRGSMHVVIPSIIRRRLEVGSVSVATVVGSKDRKRFTDRWKSDTLVLYDGGGSEESSSDDGGELVSPPIAQRCQLQQQQPGSMTGTKNDVVSLLMGKLRRDGCRVVYLQGGFSDFHKKYGHLCVGDEQPIKDLVKEGEKKGEEVEDHALLSRGIKILHLEDITQEETNRKEGRATPGSAFPFPVQVMPYLFLGNAENSADLSCLNRYGIRYILNVTPDIPNTFENDQSFKYLQIPITDNLSQNLTTFFPAAIAFIDEARGKSCGVLVHCLAGISRSVTVTVAYLMVTKSMSLNDAYDYLRRCKPNISPNFNFMGQLLDFEKILRQRMGCSLCATIPAGATVSPSCVSCRNTKTYFSSPLLDADQSSNAAVAALTTSISSSATLLTSSTSDSAPECA